MNADPAASYATVSLCPRDEALRILGTVYPESLTLERLAARLYGKDGDALATRFGAEHALADLVQEGAATFEAGRATATSSAMNSIRRTLTR